MIYRNNHYNQYNLVSESVTDIQLRWRDIKKSDYMCKKQILTAEQQLRVLENDIVGACIIDHDNVHPLHLVGISDKSNFSTYQVNRNNYEEYTSAQLILAIAVLEDWLLLLFMFMPTLVSVP